MSRWATRRVCSAKCATGSRTKRCSPDPPAWKSMSDWCATPNGSSVPAAGSSWNWDSTRVTASPRCSPAAGGTWKLCPTWPAFRASWWDRPPGLSLPTNRGPRFPATGLLACLCRLIEAPDFQRDLRRLAGTNLDFGGLRPPAPQLYVRLGGPIQFQIACQHQVLAGRERPHDSAPTFLHLRLAQHVVQRGARAGLLGHDVEAHVRNGIAIAIGDAGRQRSAVARQRDVQPTFAGYLGQSQRLVEDAGAGKGGILHIATLRDFAHLKCVILDWHTLQGERTRHPDVVAKHAAPNHIELRFWLIGVSDVPEPRQSDVNTRFRGLPAGCRFPNGFAGERQRGNRRELHLLRVAVRDDDLCEGGPALAAGPFLVSRGEPVLTRMETASAELTLGHVCRHGRKRRSEDERQLFGDGDLPRRHAAGRPHRAIDTIRGRGRHLNIYAAAILG